MKFVSLLRIIVIFILPIFAHAEYSTLQKLNKYDNTDKFPIKEFYKEKRLSWVYLDNKGVKVEHQINLAEPDNFSTFYSIPKTPYTLTKYHNKQWVTI